MKYKRFEDLPVWQKSADLAAHMFSWTQHTSFRGKGDLANQLQRATLSISNNIAEGFERGSTNELIAYIYSARGSAGEVRSMLSVMQRMRDFESLRDDIQARKSDCESISRQLRGWANSLQNSGIKGQRHLNEKTKQAYENKQRSDRFVQKLDNFREQQTRELNEEARLAANAKSQQEGE